MTRAVGTYRLVLAASQLAMRAYKYMKGRHTRKTSAFVKACFAYCHITIPSIDNIFSRLSLFVLCGQTALINQCLPQADTFFKAAIQDIVEMAENDNSACGAPRLAVDVLLPCVTVWLRRCRAWV